MQYIPMELAQRVDSNEALKLAMENVHKVFFEEIAKYGISLQSHKIRKHKGYFSLINPST